MLAGHHLLALGLLARRPTPQTRLDRRNLVLEKMGDQGYISTEQTPNATAQAAAGPVGDQQPPRTRLRPPTSPPGCASSWSTRYGAGRAFCGGLKVKTTLDLDLQEAAEKASSAPTSAASRRPPRWSCIDNKNGGIKAMVGGPDFEEHPFNLATHGHRQPGSSIKPFTLITALEQGTSPGETYTSAPQDCRSRTPAARRSSRSHNYEDRYFGSSSIESARRPTPTTRSTPSSARTSSRPRTARASLYIQKSLDAIAETIHKMGITTDITAISTNPAMVLGGLIEGVTPLEMALRLHDPRQQRRTASAAPSPPTPATARSPITEVKNKDGHTIKGGDNDSIHNQVDPGERRHEAKGILRNGRHRHRQPTPRSAATRQWGKTGTTENNGDAWFCGGDRRGHRLRLGRLRGQRRRR